MGKSNSVFGDVIVWGLGIFALTKIFGKDEEKLGQASKNVFLGCRILFDDVIKYAKLLPTIDAKGNTLPADNGITIISRKNDSVKLEIEIDTKNPKFYKVKRYLVDYVVQTTINSEGMSSIIKFDDYFKPNRDYTIKDYVGTFNTTEGVKYHESLHVDGIKRAMKSPLILDERRLMEKDISSYRAKNKKDLERMVIARSDKYIDMIGDEENKPLDPKKFKTRHSEIALEEWRYYHDTFKPLKEMRGNIRK